MLKILVVDDEMFVRRGIVMETDWAAMDCAVVAEASNGEEALEAVHRYRPDLIISDIRMPRMDGIELLKTLRQEGNEVRVIFLTAYSEFEYAKQALRYFAFDYLLKPKRQVSYMRKDHAYFGRQLSYKLEIPDMITEKLYAPFQKRFVGISAFLRRLQQGSVRLYVSYVMAAMVLVLVWGALYK